MPAPADSRLPLGSQATTAYRWGAIIASSDPSAPWPEVHWSCLPLVGLWTYRPVGLGVFMNSLPYTPVQSSLPHTSSLVTWRDHAHFGSRDSEPAAEEGYKQSKLIPSVIHSPARIAILNMAWLSQTAPATGVRMWVCVDMFHCSHRMVSQDWFLHCFS